MININKFKLNIFADGANINDFKKLKKNSLIKGFTTNPSLMRSAGVKNYLTFAKDVLNIIKKKPVSFEIFADSTKEIEEQARQISSLANNVYVKIPIINTKRKSNVKLIGKLNKEAFKKISEESIKNDISFFLMYGQTEASPRISFHKVTKSDLELENPPIGKAVPGGEILLKDDSKNYNLF